MIKHRLRLKSAVMYSPVPSFGEKDVTSDVFGEVCLLQVLEHVVEPFKRLHLRADPEKVNLFQND